MMSTFITFLDNLYKRSEYGFDQHIVVYFVVYVNTAVIKTENVRIYTSSINFYFRT